MYQINKLRQKLANATKHSVEYKMSIDDARALLVEIDELLKPVASPPTTVATKEKIITRILDGGKF